MGSKPFIRMGNELAPANDGFTSGFQICGVGACGWRRTVKAALVDVSGEGGSAAGMVGLSSERSSVWCAGQRARAAAAVRDLYSVCLFVLIGLVETH